MPRLTTRDYKRKSRGSSPARLKDFGLGLLVGAVLASVAFVLAGAHARHRAAASSRVRAGEDSHVAAPHAPAPNDTSADGSRDAGASDAAASSRPSSTSSRAKAPQYDFYKMLPRFNVPVPHDDEPASHAAAPPAQAAAHPVGSAASYVLQVGSYRSSAEADQVRARLARAGIAAQVEQVAAGAKTWNRVRIGPLDDAQLARVRKQLRTADMHALVIRADR
jgi:cell division protein FtsN